MKEKDNKVLIERIKEGLLKYHKLIIPEQTDVFANSLDSTELKLIAKKMKQDIEKADSNKEIHKNLVTVRVRWGNKTNGLTIDPANRRKWIDGLIAVDILDFKSKTTAMLDYLISKSNPRVQALSLAVISMIASSDAGLDYLTQNNPDFVRTYYEHLIHVPEMTVAHRFALAILYKMSSHKTFALQLLDLKVDSYLQSFMESYQKKKGVHSFFPIFYTALGYNIFTSPHTREKLGKFTTRYSPVLAEYLDFFKRDLPSAAHLNILETFRTLLGPQEVYYRDLLIESRASETLRLYFSSLQAIFAGRPHILDVHLDLFAQTITAALAPKPKLTDKEELAARKLEKEKEEAAVKDKDKPRKMHDFEAFKDEILEEQVIA